MERITVLQPADGDEMVEVFLNKEGLERLILDLQALNKENDHFHLFGPGWAGDDLRDRPYRTGDRIIQHLKVLYRPDDWDREYFPHVLDTENPEDRETRS